MMNKVSLLAIVGLMLLSFTCAVSAQDVMTKKAGEYLVNIKEIDAANYSSKTKSKSQEIVANLYVDKLLELRSNNQHITFYKLGSYIEHQRPHFALVKNEDFENLCFVDCTDVDAGISALMACLKIEGVERRELQAFKAKAVKYYINGFPAASSVK
ncbi:MAG: hypothetical protein ACTHOF_13890 [Flavisolibacter sp.]